MSSLKVDVALKFGLEKVSFDLVCGQKRMKETKILQNYDIYSGQELIIFVKSDTSQDKSSNSFLSSEEYLTLQDTYVNLETENGLCHTLSQD